MSRNAVLGVAAGLGVLTVGLLVGATAVQSQPSPSATAREGQASGAAGAGATHPYSPTDDLRPLVGREITVHIREDAAGPHGGSYLVNEHTMRRGEAIVSGRLMEVRVGWIVLRRPRFDQRAQLPASVATETWLPMTSVLAISRDIPNPGREAP